MRTWFWHRTVWEWFMQSLIIIIISGWRHCDSLPLLSVLILLHPVDAKRFLNLVLPSSFWLSPSSFPFSWGPLCCLFGPFVQRVQPAILFFPQGLAKWQNRHKNTFCPIQTLTKNSRNSWVWKRAKEMKKIIWRNYIDEKRILYRGRVLNSRWQNV
jgi:hypothetical protein